MLTHPNISPIALQLGPISIHWYGLMYVAAFASFLWLMKRRARADAWRGFASAEVDDLLFYGAIGVIVGGRLGEVLLYQLPYYARHPLEIFVIWKGGMSFHGGLIGVLVAMWLYARKTQRSFWQVTDFIAPAVPLGYAFGRIGNFINQELVGRPTDSPLGMVFPMLQDNIARHPSQLYHAALDGLALFVGLWLYSRTPRPLGAVSAWFLIGYGLFRSFVEFFRTPDFSVSFGPLSITSGQLYCLPMIAVGVYLLSTGLRTLSRTK